MAVPKALRLIALSGTPDGEQRGSSQWMGAFLSLGIAAGLLGLGVLVGGKR